MNYRMSEMTWPQFEARKDKPVIVPIGSTEQHSQHLPLGTDALIADRIALDLAKAVDGTVMPTLAYGYKSKPLSGGGPLFPGTIDMNGVTVINQMHDVLHELIDDGFTKSASILGSFMVATVTSITGKPSLGVLSIGVLLVLALVFLVLQKDPMKA